MKNCISHEAYKNIQKSKTRQKRDCNTRANPNIREQRIERKRKWMTYPSNLRLNKFNEYFIYLDNSTGIHFDVVIDS